MESMMAVALIASFLLWVLTLYSTCSDLSTTIGAHHRGFLLAWTIHLTCWNWLVGEIGYADKCSVCWSSFVG